MKKYRIDVDRMNGYQTLKYQVQVADVVDERAVDRSRTTQVPGMMYMQPAEVSGQKMMLVNVPDFPTLSTHFRQALRGFLSAASLRTRM